jgi:hypothetical protein
MSISISKLSPGCSFCNGYSIPSLPLLFDNCKDPSQITYSTFSRLILPCPSILRLLVLTVFWLLYEYLGYVIVGTLNTSRLSKSMLDETWTTPVFVGKPEMKLELILVRVSQTRTVNILLTTSC